MEIFKNHFREFLEIPLAKDTINYEFFANGDKIFVDIFKNKTKIKTCNFDEFFSNINNKMMFVEACAQAGLIRKSELSKFYNNHINVIKDLIINHFSKNKEPFDVETIKGKFVWRVNKES